MTRPLIFALMLLASPAMACGPGTDCYQPPAPPPVVTPETPTAPPGDSETPGQSTGRTFDICCVREDGAVMFKSPLHLFGPQQCLKAVAEGKRPKCGEMG